MNECILLCMCVYKICAMIRERFAHAVFLVLLDNTTDRIKDRVAKL